MDLRAGLIQAAAQSRATQANALGLAPDWGVLGDYV